MEFGYKYRNTLSDHVGDVRCLVSISNDIIVSGSRDRTAKIWKAKDSAIEFDLQSTLTGHDNYVAAVAISNLYDTYRNGLILTASNDKTIRAYDPVTNENQFVLSGHTDTVCALSCYGEFIASGSWDTTAKIWKGQTCIAELKGHKATIWSVIIIPTKDKNRLLIATGSADKTINVWCINDLSGNQIIKPIPAACLEGHTDCIRSLACYDEDHIFSAGNDGSVRVWNLMRAQCVGEYRDHTNFVYSVAVSKQLNLMVSSGEDRTVRIWNIEQDKWGHGKSFECQQVISFPCVSVWSVCILPNGDIAGGGSDFQIRVFSRDPSRQASVEIQNAFKEEVSAAQLPKQTGLTGTELSEEKLPGIEALQVPGKKEGQVIVVKEGTNCVCYQWSQMEMQWVKVGDVVGSGGSKHWHDGKEYDFIFDVDVDPSRPPLKLPFNKDEDPWFAAQTFIHKNNLPQDYLETVAKYIIQNAQLEDKPPTQTSCDPFTGGGRYIPGSTKLTPSENFFPANQYVSMMSVQVQPLIKKLKSINESESSKLSEDCFANIEKMTQSSQESEIIKIVKNLLPALSKWKTADCLLPVFDVLRFCAHWRKGVELLCEASVWSQLVQHSMHPPDASQPHATNSLLMMRLLCNAVEPSVALAKAENNQTSRSLVAMLSAIHVVVECVEANKFDLPNKKMMQVALATFFHNLSVLASDKEVAQLKLVNKYPVLRALHGLCLRVAFGQLQLIHERVAQTGVGAMSSVHPEAIFRLLVTVGTALVSVCEDRSERVCLLASCATGDAGSDSPTTPEPGNPEFARKWDKCRACIQFWADSQHVTVKSRECATSILTALEE